MVTLSILYPLTFTIPSSTSGLWLPYQYYTPLPSLYPALPAGYGYLPNAGCPSDRYFTDFAATPTGGARLDAALSPPSGGGASPAARTQDFNGSLIAIFLSLFFLFYIQFLPLTYFMDSQYIFFPTLFPFLILFLISIAMMASGGILSMMNNLGYPTTQGQTFGPATSPGNWKICLKI